MNAIWKEERGSEKEMFWWDMASANILSVQITLKFCSKYDLRMYYHSSSSLTDQITWSKINAMIKTSSWNIVVKRNNFIRSDTDAGKLYPLACRRERTGRYSIKIPVSFHKTNTLHTSTTITIFTKENFLCNKTVNDEE